ncbi:hypothetical protein BH23BAC3_BH23BAC3_15470 [soil metagenome]
MMDTATTVSVIGPGALGGALIDLLLKKPVIFSLYSVWGRTLKDSYLQKGADRKTADTSFPEKKNDLGELILITVPDDQIAPIAERLSGVSLDWNRYAVVHFSGNHSSDLLASLSKKGAAVASMHPLQTFTKGDDANRFKDIWFTIEGTEVIYPKLEMLAKKADAFSRIMNPDQKKAMHLAAVFASNYLVSLMSAVEKITLANNIDQGVEMMRPLIHQTLDNIFQKGVDESLSGPIVRGDKSTLRAHLELLNQEADLQLLYKHLGIQALQITEKSDRLSKKDAESIWKILSGNES